MKNVKKYEKPIKFSHNYKWPDNEAARDCPKCGQPMQLVEDRAEYFGKPWWCSQCQWQFSEEDLEGQLVTDNVKPLVD